MSVPGEPAFIAAIVGRPNVGKSTLFNRLVGKRLALVDDRPGVTRDRREGDARLGDLEFRVIDTAGLEEAEAASLEARMRRQTDLAIADSDVVLFLVDARAGITPADEHFAELVRRSGKPVILVANKAEGRSGAQAAIEAYELGLGDPLPLSAEHGEGLGDLYDALAVHAPPPVEEDEDTEEDESSGPLKIAVIGRPNAGKSTLVNRMLGEERLLTGPEAGITRDSIAVEWTWRGHALRVFDTAGLRKKARIEEKLEKLSVADALRAVRFAEVVIVLIDATQPFEKQDLTIIDLVEREGRALVVGANKWDLVAGEPGKLKALTESFERLLPQVKGTPLAPVSGLSGRGIEALMEAVMRAHGVWNTRISTGRLNRWIAGVLESHPPPAVAGRRIKIRYLTQVKSRPPTFALFGNQLADLPRSYTRYLVNGLRTSFELPGTPIRLMLRSGENPYDKD